MSFGQKLAMMYVICSLVYIEASFALNRTNFNAYSTRIAYSHKIHISFYPVEGNSPKELKESMLARGPIGHGNIRFFAYTLWHLKFTGTSKSSYRKVDNPSCYISVLLPFLRQEAASNFKIQNDWKKFMSSMIAHESHHVKTAMRAHRQLLRMPDSDAYLSAVAARLKKRDQNYDKLTKHGRSEGVALL